MVRIESSGFASWTLSQVCLQLLQQCFSHGWGKYIWGRYLSGCRVRIWRFLVGAVFFFLAFLQQLRDSWFAAIGCWEILVYNTSSIICWHEHYHFGTTLKASHALAPGIQPLRLALYMATAFFATKICWSLHWRKTKRSQDGGRW